MAANRASVTLVAVVATFVLFGLLAAVSHLKVLEKHGYDTGIGWQTAKPAFPPAGQCDRVLITRGFPLTTRRPATSAEDATGCLDDTNPLANAMNYAIYFALACIVAAAVANAARNKL